MSMPSSRRRGGDHGRQPAGLELLLDLAAAPGTPSRGAPGRRTRAATGCAAPDWAMIWAGGAPGRGSPGRSSASSLSRAVSRSASRRELANTIVERWASIRSSTRSSTCGQIDGRSALRGRPSGRRRARRARTCPRPAPRPTGRSSCPTAAARWSTGRPPAGSVATSSTGRTVADSPMRWAGRSSRASSRSSDSARCAPRLVAATACTSSTITVSTPRSASRAAEVSSRNSDSGVVIRMSAGVRAKARRSSAEVSPDRMRDRDVRLRQAQPARGLPDAGQRRAQVALDVDRQRLERADVEHPAAPHRVVGQRVSAASRSSAERNAASVLPEPVGATTSVCSPSAMACQAPSWAAVGAGEGTVEPGGGRPAAKRSSMPSSVRDGYDDRAAPARP